MQTSSSDARHARLLLAILLPIALIAVLAALAGTVYPTAAATVPFARPGVIRADVVLSPTAYFPIVFEPWPSCGATPCLLSPKNRAQITTLAPLFVWNAGPASEDGYWTDFSDFSPYTSIFYCFHGTPCQNPSSGIVSVRGTGWLWSSWYRNDANLLPGTTYSWGIRRCNWNYQCQQSEIWTFTTPANVTLPPAPAVITPTSGSTVPGPQVKLEWSPVDGALAYEFCLSRSSSSPYNRNCTWVETTALTVQLVANLQYYWHVAALGPEGEGPGVLGAIRVTGTQATGPAKATTLSPFRLSGLSER